MSRIRQKRGLMGVCFDGDLHGELSDGNKVLSTGLTCYALVVSFSFHVVVFPVLWRCRATQRLLQVRVKGVAGMV